MLSNRLLSIFHLQSLFKSCCRPAIPLQRAQTAVNNRSPTPQTRHVQPIRALQANAAQRVRPPSSPLFFSPPALTGSYVGRERCNVDAS